MVCLFTDILKECPHDYKAPPPGRKLAGMDQALRMTADRQRYIGTRGGFNATQGGNNSPPIRTGSGECAEAMYCKRFM